VREYTPIELSGSVTKSGSIFVTLDGEEGDNVQNVDTDCCIILRIKDLDADVVNTSLESLQERISENFISHLIY
jgi:hypothetical protein